MKVIAVEVWQVLKPGLALLVFFSVLYLVHRLVIRTFKESFHDFMLEVGAFINRDPNERSMNMLFGIFIFVAIILLTASIAVSSLFGTVLSDRYLINIPEGMIILCSIFLLVVFFIISLAYCKKIGS